MRSYSSSVLVALIIFGTGFLTGCATQPANLYKWGSYEAEVYNHFTNGSSPEAQILALEKNLQAAAAGACPVPPGYHAHLGLLYGEMGRFADMKKQLETEKALYPESTTFMDFLLKKMNKAPGAKQ